MLAFFLPVPRVSNDMQWRSTNDDLGKLVDETLFASCGTASIKLVARIFRLRAELAPLFPAVFGARLRGGVFHAFTSVVFVPSRLVVLVLAEPVELQLVVLPPFSLALRNRALFA